MLVLFSLHFRPAGALISVLSYSLYSYSEQLVFLSFQRPCSSKKGFCLFCDTQNAAWPFSAIPRFGDIRNFSSRASSAAVPVLPDQSHQPDHKPEARKIRKADQKRRSHCALEEHPSFLRRNRNVFAGQRITLLSFRLLPFPGSSGSPATQKRSIRHLAHIDNGAAIVVVILLRIPSSH